MEILAVLLVVSVVTTAGPLLVRWLDDPALSIRRRYAMRMVASLQDLGLPPTGGMLGGSPPVVVYRDPDGTIAVIAALPFALTMQRSSGGGLGYSISGRRGLVTVDAVAAIDGLQALVIGGEIRARCRRSVDLVHTVDGVRELWGLLVAPTVDALEATARALPNAPDQLGACLVELRHQDAARFDTTANDLLARSDVSAACRVELFDALRRDYELVNLAVSSAATGRHVVAWEAALRVGRAAGPHDPLLRWAPALVGFEVCARALLRALEDRWTPTRGAWLVAEWRGGLTAWSPGARGWAAELTARTTAEIDLLVRLLSDPFPAARAAAVDHLGEAGPIEVVPALRHGQADGSLPPAAVDRAIARIQARAGGVAGALSLDDTSDEGSLGGSVSLPPFPAFPAGHVALVAADAEPSIEIR